MFRIVSPYLLLLYCLTSILTCSLCQALPRPVRFFALCHLCNGRPLLSLLLSRRIRLLAPVFLPLSTVFFCFPLVIVLVFSTFILSPNLWLLLCTSSVSSRSCPSSSTIRSMSSANLRLLTVLYCIVFSFYWKKTLLTERYKWSKLF